MWDTVIITTGYREGVHAKRSLSAHIKHTEVSPQTHGTHEDLLLCLPRGLLGEIVSQKNILHNMSSPNQNMSTLFITSLRIFDVAILRENCQTREKKNLTYSNILLLVSAKTDALVDHANYCLVSVYKKGRIPNVRLWSLQDQNITQNQAGPYINLEELALFKEQDLVGNLPTQQTRSPTYSPDAEHSAFTCDSNVNSSGRERRSLWQSQA